MTRLQDASPGEHGKDRRRIDRRFAVGLGIVAFLAYNANCRTVGVGDSLPARFLPFALWGYGTLYLDPVYEATRAGSPEPYWMQPSREKHWASLFPIVRPVLVSPLYIPAVVYLKTTGWTEERLEQMGALMEKLAASLVASFAVGLMFLLLRRRLPRGDALLLGAAFAFCTNTWVTGSQALWMHGMAELLLTGALWFITLEPARWSIAAAGVLAGLAAVNRPPDAILAAGLAIYALFWARRSSWLFAVSAAVPVLLATLYNWQAFHNLLGGWGSAGIGTSREFYRGFSGGPFFASFAGILISPGKGLLVFAPFLIFLPLFLVRSLRDAEYRRLSIILALSAAAQVCFYATVDWRAGASYGPRYLTDMLPMLIWLLAPVLASLRAVGKTAFIGTCFFSAWVQWVGAFRYQGASDLIIHADVPPEHKMDAAWKPQSAAFFIEMHQAAAPQTLLGVLRGDLFRPEAGKRNLILVGWQSGRALGEITASAPVRETFLCPVAELRDLAVVFNTYQRRNPGRVDLSLSEGGTTLVRRIVASQEIQDNGWVALSLPRFLAPCRDRLLVIEIQSSNVPGQAVTVWSYPRYYRGVLRQGKNTYSGYSLGLELNREAAR